MFRSMILILLAVGLVCAPCLATTWDLAGNWSTVSNPNGQWSYGRVASGGVGSPSSLVSYGFTPFPNTGTHTVNSLLQQWRNNGDEITAWTYNSDSSTQSWQWIGNLPSHKVGVVPANGSGAAVPVARWTCPTSGWYQISSSFQRIYTAGTTDLHVIKSGVGIFPSHLYYVASMGYATDAFTGLQNMSAGQTLDFCVGNADGDWTNDGTMVDATVSTTTAPGTVTGTVTTSPSGNPIYGAEIRVVGTNYYAYTAADGTYSLNLPAGNYTIQAGMAGNNSAQVSGVVVTAGNTASGVNLSLVSWGYVAGRVTSSPEAQVISGATVTRVGGTESATTASDGTYSIFMAPGTYSFLASKTGFDSVQRSGIVVPSSGTAANTDFALPTWGRIAGTVRSNLPGNPPISGVKVQTTTGGYTTYTGPDGSYSFYAPAGGYSINVTCSGYVSQSASGLSVANGTVVTKNFTLASSSISGVVTSESSGGPVAGAYVRTEGEPAYSAVTAPDGSYSIVAPGGTYNLLVSGAGYDPQKSPVVTTAGSGTSISFALRTASTGGSLLSLPAPLDSGEPCLAPRGIGDTFPVSFADTGSMPVANAPVISMWNRMIKPDESFTMTGRSFTLRSGADAGTDTTVWIWARTSDAGGILRQAKLWKVTDNTIVATMPDDIPFGMYLVWVENEAGVSLPACINKPVAQWVGPLGYSVQAGNKKRVFGRNISYLHGTSVSHVYIQPASGGAMTECPASTANPYMVEFTVPIGTANGSYKAYVHNGSGGIYGWSDGLDLVVQNDWVRGGTVINVTSNGTDDSTNIQNAINSLTGMANGGTVQLTSGNYILKNVLNLKTNVEIRGAGMNLTNVLLQLSASTNNPGIAISGNNTSLRDLTLRLSAGYGRPSNFAFPLTQTEAGGKYINYRQVLDPNIDAIGNFTLGPNTEISNCEMINMVTVLQDCWVHGGNHYGGPFASQIACFNSSGARNIIEGVHIETLDWPTSATGSRNYLDFMTYQQLMYLRWAKRVAIPCNSYNYLANITTKDVTEQGDQSEMILFHGMNGMWGGNVISSNGLTVNLRTDGLVDGQAIQFVNSVPGGQPLSDRQDFWYNVDLGWATVMTGRGAGQTRKIVSHTPSTVTVDKPWTVQPDSTSKLAIQVNYYGNTVYNNELNGFPVGYIQGYSNTCGISFDGNCWDTVAENNISRRTNGSRSIMAASNCILAYWDEMRDEEAYDINLAGASAPLCNVNPAGPAMIGSAFRGGEYVVNGPNPPSGYITGGAIVGDGVGTVIENLAITSKRGLMLAGMSGQGMFADNFSLCRNNTVTTTDDSTTPAVAQPVYLAATDGKQFLINNTYTNSTTPYALNTGLTSYTIPVALQRVARFSGYVGYPVQSQLVTLANAGIAPMTWTVTASDPWISAGVQSNGTTSPESTLGRVVIGANTTGMTAGRHWGSVTVNTGTSAVKIGVCVDLSSGVPSNQIPVASFTTSATAGTVPFAITFNAGASYDVDGIITSYVWDFGDGTYGTGVAATHQYTKVATYTPVLTVTDDDGATGTSWANIVAAPSLSSVTLAGNPTGCIDIGTPVALTVSSVGGYQVQYKFLVNFGSGWQTIRDYGTGGTFSWTPSASGYYELKVWARSSVSTNAYDAVSNIVSYPVGLIPSGAKLWLKADSGTTQSGGNVSAWADQSGSGNNVSQGDDTKRPTFVANAINGRPVVRFPGSSQVLQSAGQVLSGGTGFTTFTVGSLSALRSPANYQYFWWNGGDSANTGYGCYLYFSPQCLRTAWSNNSAYLADPSAAAIGTLYRVTSRFQGNTLGTHEMWINGGTSTPVSRNKTNSGMTGGVFSVGNYGPSPGNGLYGDVAEIIIYDRALSDTERASVDSYLAARWMPPTPLAVDRIQAVKALGDGILVSITSPKVAITASGVYSDGSVYISETDRTCGMRIVNAGSVSLWDNLTITGTTDTDSYTGERVLRVSTVSKSGSTEIGSLGMNGKAVTAAGQLVRAWGKVKEKTASYLTLDDGSGVTVRAQTDGLSVPIAVTANIGDYVSVIGPAGLMAGGTPAIRVRSGADIVVY